jgi:hypothetical protein
MKDTNYQATKIYKIVCLNDDIKDIYVGSTSLELKVRYCHHVCCLTTNPDKKLSKFITENGGIENWKIELIEDYPCNTQEERLWRERHWYDLLKPSLNYYKPIRSKEETKEQMKENTKRYISDPVKKERKKEMNKLSRDKERDRELATIRRNNRTQEEKDTFNAKRKETRNAKKNKNIIL